MLEWLGGRLAASQGQPTSLPNLYEGYSMFLFLLSPFLSFCCTEKKVDRQNHLSYSCISPKCTLS